MQTATWAEGNAEFLAAVTGPEQKLPRVLKLFDCPDIRDAFPWFRLAGVVAPVRSLAMDMGLKMSKIKVFGSFDELFEACPGVSMIIDLHGDPAKTTSLRDTVPGHVSVADAGVFEVLWEMLMSGKLCGPVEDDLYNARAYLHTVLGGLEEDILLLDGAGHVVDANSNLFVRLDRGRDDVIGLHCREIEGGDFCRRDRRECPFEETLVTGKKAEAVHTKLDEDGRLQYFRVYTYPLFDERGQLSRVVELRRDITTRTHIEQRLQQAHKMAAIGELSTYIAHEIRNPLFAIGGFASSLLKRNELDPQAREKVSIIYEESQRLDDILRSILSYARPTEARVEEVDVNVVAGETVKLMALGCEPQGICLDVDLAPGIARAKGVPDLLKQCLINMIKNGMEAMAQSGGTITLRTGMRDSMVFVQVRDEGVGIPEDVLHKVFNPFFSTKDKGSGLGLAMTRKIVEEVGGTVDLVSEFGRGTTVTILLPPSLAVDGDTLDAMNGPA